MSQRYKRIGKAGTKRVWLLGSGIIVALLIGVGLFVVLRQVFAASVRVVPIVAQQSDSTALPGMPDCCPGTPGTDSSGAPETVPPDLIPGPTETSTPAAPTATPTPRPAFGLAWFHKPPSDGTTPQQMAAQLSYIHLTGPADIDYRNELRQAGYKGPIYTYVTAIAVEGPGPYKDSSAKCQAGYSPLDNQLAFYKDDFCKYIHPHESWFLHNGAGERLAEDYSGSGHWTYIMNPADPGWQAFAQERLLFIRDHWGYEGIWLDNLDLSLDRALSEPPMHDDAVKEFSTDEQYRAGMVTWLAGVRAKLGSYPLWANLVNGGDGATAWDAYAPYLDGAMDESFSVRWVDEWRAPEAWASQLERADRWLKSGKGLVMVGQGPKDDVARMRFTLASYMLVAQGQQAFFRYTRWDSYYNSLWLYPDYATARALGNPLGPRQEIRSGVWARQFEHGTVEVDLGAHTGSLALK